MFFCSPPPPPSDVLVNTWHCIWLHPRPGICISPAVFHSEMYGCQIAQNTIWCCFTSLERAENTYKHLKGSWLNLSLDKDANWVKYNLTLGDIKMPNDIQTLSVIETSVKYQCSTVLNTILITLAIIMNLVSWHLVNNSSLKMVPLPIISKLTTSL